MSHLTHFRALSGGGCKPDHRGLEPLTQSRAAQTAAYEVTAFIAMDAPFMGISNAGANLHPPASNARNVVTCVI